jgi:hypothetical protein
MDHPKMSTKFVVKVNRVGCRPAQYVQRIDQSRLRTTTNRKLALIMGKFIAEDVINSMDNPRCKPELVPVQIVL